MRVPRSRAKRQQSHTCGSRQHRRGFSLVEILVAMMLMALVFDILYSLLMPGLRAWMKGSARSELQQGGVVATQWLTDEFTASTTDSVVIVQQSYTDPVTSATEECDMLSFYSPYDATNQIQYQQPLGTLLWQKRVIYYLDPNSNDLMRQEQPFDATRTTPPTAPTLDPTNPAPPAVDPNVHSRVIARNVLNLTFSANTRKTPDGRTIPADPITMALSFRMKNNPDLYTAEASVSALFTNY